MSWLSKVLALAEFFIFYIKEIIISNIRVAYDVLTPTHLMRPEIVTVSTTDMSDRQLLALANLITMTPGTLSVDISENREKLFIHAMYVKDPEAFSAELERSFVRRIRRVF